jgi:hypothetical protein
MVVARNNRFPLCALGVLKSTSLKHDVTGGHNTHALIASNKVIIAIHVNTPTSTVKESMLASARFPSLITTLTTSLRIVQHKEESLMQS